MIIPPPNGSTIDPFRDPVARYGPYPLLRRRFPDRPGETELIIWKNGEWRRLGIVRARTFTLNDWDPDPRSLSNLPKLFCGLWTTSDTPGADIMKMFGLAAAVLTLAVVFIKLATMP